MRKQQTETIFKCYRPTTTEEGGGGGERRPPPKGFVPVLVGREEAERFLVSIGVLKHPRFVGLLEMAAQEFGYTQKRGALRIPCDAQHFDRVIRIIVSDTSALSE